MVGSCHHGALGRPSSLHLGCLPLGAAFPKARAAGHLAPGRTERMNYLHYFRFTLKTNSCLFTCVYYPEWFCFFRLITCKQYSSIQSQRTIFTARWTGHVTPLRCRPTPTWLRLLHLLLLTLWPIRNVSTDDPAGELMVGCCGATHVHLQGQQMWKCMHVRACVHPCVCVRVLAVLREKLQTVCLSSVLVCDCREWAALTNTICQQQAHLLADI